MLKHWISNSSTPLPTEFLEWQVKLRKWTAIERNGAPHAGVAPVLCVQQPGVGPGVSMHAIICGLLPAPAQLAEKTREFRTLYERHAAEGARAIYDAGIEYLKGYYEGGAADFDAESITALLPEDAPAVRALRAHTSCALLFYVFDLDDKSEEGRFRCLQVNGVAELHDRGEVYDNVWWHYALFHGKVDGHVVLRVVHQSTYDTGFGQLESAS
ncbi:MAG TPA: hypothetical protein VMV01_18895 [Planctomycetota bacterium]|nr:hypothetical protein [Planctomycetota bacterium]